MLSDDALRQFREDLVRRLEDLDHDSQSSTASRQPVELDQTAVGRLSRMDAIQQQAMALAAERRRQTERRKLLAAIERIDGDDYGICIRCGEEIGDDRLAFDPAITLCKSCMKRD